VHKRRFSIFAVVAIVTSLSLAGTPAGADHRDPRVPQAPTEGVIVPAPVTFGEGTWRHIDNFPVNPGTDLEFFQAGGEIYAASGTLGQAPVDHVGQRIVQLTANGGSTVLPTWEADHGSAACDPRSTSITGLQHDSQVTGYTDPELLIDTTDATGRCHDGVSPNGGGLEFVDISDIQNPAFAPREIHLTRMAGFSHTHTVDATRPWVVYNSSSDFSGRNWIDVADIRSCLGLEGQTLAQKRDACRPKVYRINFQPDWSRQRNWYDGQLRPGTEAACHDITSVGTRIYCAALNATLIFDVANLTDPSTGAVRGRALPCTVTNGTNTAAKVTDCSGGTLGRPQAEGWTFLGTFNHPGRDCAPAELPPNYSCNNNLFVRSDEGVSVSHEADPTHDGNYMFVTDERGGGVVPPGATCVAPGVDNPYGNGGIHTFDISDPTDIEYAQTPNGGKAIWRSDIVPPAATFCDVHVIEHIPGEQRLIVAYYDGGTKIVDYFIDSNGRFTFRETASIILPLANTWAVEDFKIIPGDLSGRTKTYFFVATDIQRGIDVLSWTGRPNPIGTPPPAPTSVTAADAGLLGVVLVALPAAAWFGRRRRRGIG
jgi:hypothetical protein